MENPISINILPANHKEPFKWGYYQKVKIFLINNLRDHAIFIRGIDILHQLPLNIKWYGNYFGNISFSENNQKCTHQFLAQGITPNIFATGLLLPRQKLRIDTGMRLHNNKQFFKIGFHTLPMDVLERTVYFRQEKKYPLIENYELPSKQNLRSYLSQSSIPDEFRSRAVISTELDNVSLNEKIIEVPLHLEDRMAKTRIEKLIEEKQNILYYYVAPINQWFFQNNGKAYFLEKEYAKLKQIEIPELNMFLLDCMESNSRKEAVFIRNEENHPLLEKSLLQKNVEYHGNYCYIGIENIEDIIDILLSGDLKIRLVEKELHNNKKNFFLFILPNNIFLTLLIIDRVLMI